LKAFLISDAYEILTLEEIEPIETPRKLSL